MKTLTGGLIGLVGLIIVFVFTFQDDLGLTFTYAHSASSGVTPKDLGQVVALANRCDIGNDNFDDFVRSFVRKRAQQNQEFSPEFAVRSFDLSIARGVIKDHSCNHARARYGETIDFMASQTRYTSADIHDLVAKPPE